MSGIVFLFGSAIATLGRMSDSAFHVIFLSLFWSIPFVVMLAAHHLHNRLSEDGTRVYVAILMVLLLLSIIAHIDYHTSNASRFDGLWIGLVTIVGYTVSVVALVVAKITDFWRKRRRIRGDRGLTDM